MFSTVSSIDGVSEVVDQPPSPSVLTFPSPDPRSKSHWKLSEKDGERPHKDREKDGEYFWIPSSPRPHFVVDRSTWTIAGVKNLSSAAKSREHDWERLHRRFTWLPKLTIQEANDITNDLVYKPTDFSGPHHSIVDVGFGIAEAVRGPTVDAVEPGGGGGEGCCPVGKLLARTVEHGRCPDRGQRARHRRCRHRDGDNRIFD